MERESRLLLIQSAEDDWAADLAAIDRVMTKLSQHAAVINDAVTALDDVVAAPLFVQVEYLQDQIRALTSDRDTILSRRGNRQLVSRVLDSLGQPEPTVDALSDQERRAMLAALAVKAWVWPKGHVPRYIIDVTTDLLSTTTALEAKSSACWVEPQQTEPQQTPAASSSYDDEPVPHSWLDEFGGYKGSDSMG